MSNYDRIIEKWQIHTLSFTQEKVEEIYGEGATPRILTGTVVEDLSGKFQSGDHFRSSIIKKIDEENGIVYTVSKTLKIEGPEGDPTLGNEDVGDFVLNIFY